MFILSVNLSFSSDIDFSLSEKAINSFTTAASPIEFSKKIKVLDGEAQANFAISNVNIELAKDKITLTGHLNIGLNGSTLDANISGELNPIIDKKTGELSLNLSKVDIKGLEFLKLDNALKDQVIIPLKINELKPIKIKKSDTEYLEVISKISNEKIIVTENKITVLGDIIFVKGKVKKY